jgi:hypothetical protein
LHWPDDIGRREAGHGHAVELGKGDTIHTGRVEDGPLDGSVAIYRDSPKWGRADRKIHRRLLPE